MNPIHNGVPAPKTVRCAIYTRKSTEEGLEQEFNSLHAQREAAQAYLASQQHQGWIGLFPVRIPFGELVGQSGKPTAGFTPLRSRGLLPGRPGFSAILPRIHVPDPPMSKRMSGTQAIHHELPPTQNDFRTLCFAREARQKS